MVLYWAKFIYDKYRFEKFYVYLWFKKLISMNNLHEIFSQLIFRLSD